MESTANEQVLLLSASGESDLKRYAGALAAALDELLDGSRPAAELLADAAFTLQVGRTPLPHRLAASAPDADTARAALRAAASGDEHPALRWGRTDDAADAAGDPVAAWLARGDVDWAARWPAPRRRLSLPGSPWPAARAGAGPAPT